MIRTWRRLIPAAVIAVSACSLTSQAANASPAPAVAGAAVASSLTDVSCVSTANCMAVGWAQASGSGTIWSTLAEEWNGTSWRIVPTPSPSHPGGGAKLAGVSCPSASYCVAVGESLAQTAGSLAPAPLAMTWNGSKWSVVTTPAPEDAAGALSSISCATTSNCMAVGSQGADASPAAAPLAMKWNAVRWGDVVVPGPAQPGAAALTRVSCPAGFCMAVGYGGLGSAGTALTLAEKWTGSAWKLLTTPTPGGSGQFAGVRCFSSANCVGVGWRADSLLPLGQVTLAEKWNGTSWKTQTTVDPAGIGAATLDGVACATASACLSTGSTLDLAGLVRLTLGESADGAHWGLLPTANPSTLGDELLSVACPAAADCLAVGDYTPLPGGQSTLAEEWNGSTWTALTTPNP